jgi:hypothetical protein
VDDTFRLDLEGYNNEYIQSVLDGFLERAPRHGRKVAEIRMRKVLFDRMAVHEEADRGIFKGVPVVVADTGFDGAIEVVPTPLN